LTGTKMLSVTKEGLIWTATITKANYTGKIMWVEGETPESFSVPTDWKISRGRNLKGEALADVQSVSVSQSPIILEADQLTGAVTSEEFSSNIVVYPNPFTDYINIQSPSLVGKPMSITLKDLASYTVEKYATVTGTMELNIQNLPEGLYLLEIESEGNKVVKKVVKQR